MYSAVESVLMIRVAIIIVLVALLCAKCTQSTDSSAPITIGTQFAISFCNNYGDVVGEAVYTCYPRSQAL